MDTKTRQPAKDPTPAARSGLSDAERAAWADVQQTWSSAALLRTLYLVSTRENRLARR